MGRGLPNTEQGSNKTGPNCPTYTTIRNYETFQAKEQLMINNSLRAFSTNSDRIHLAFSKTSFFSLFFFPPDFVNLNVTQLLIG